MTQAKVKLGVKQNKIQNKMKKSEFKEYLKTEIRKMNEATIETDSAETAAKIAKEIPDATIKVTGEGKIKVSEFKKYLRNEILAEINEAEEDNVDVNIDNIESTPIEPTATDETSELDGISDSLVNLARQAKEMGQLELANQILNSAKYAAKTQFKGVEKGV
jgi:hypothetical protein